MINIINRSDNVESVACSGNGNINDNYKVVEKITTDT